MSEERATYTGLARPRGKTGPHARHRRRGSPPPPCEAPGCQQPVCCRRICKIHYERWRKHGDPHTVHRRGPPARACGVGGCEGTHVARGYCRTHYDRWRLDNGRRGGRRA